MNWRISTYRNDMGRKNSPTCDKHFQNPGKKLNKHAKFSIIKKKNSASLHKQQRQSFLKYIFRYLVWRLSLSKRSERILKLSQWQNSFHLVKLFQFLLGLLSALFFLVHFFKFPLSHGCVHLIHEFIWSDYLIYVTISTKICSKSKTFLDESKLKQHIKVNYPDTRIHGKAVESDLSTQMKNFLIWQITFLIFFICTW